MKITAVTHIILTIMKINMMEDPEDQKLTNASDIRFTNA